MLHALAARPWLILILVVLAASSLVLAVDTGLLPRPFRGLAGVSPLPAQGIVGHVSLGPVAPVCYIGQSSVQPVLPDRTGIVYGQGINETVSISWKLANCSAEGDFQIFLFKAGLYYFTLNGCTSSLRIGCTNLPASVQVFARQMAHLNVTVDTGIR